MRVFDDKRYIKHIKMNKKYFYKRRECIEWENGVYFTSHFRVSYLVICIRLKWCTPMYHRNRVIYANCSTYISAKQTREKRELLYWNNDLHNSAANVHIDWHDILKHITPLTVRSRKPTISGWLLNWFLDVSFNYFLHKLS